MNNQDHNSNETQQDESSIPNEQLFHQPDLDPETLKILPLILDAIQKVKRVSADDEFLNSRGLVRSSFSGPLPPQVLQKMSQEKADALVDDLIAQNTAENQFNLKYLETYKEIHRDKTRDSQIRFFALLLFALLLVLICAYFDNWQFLFDLIPVVGAALAGGGGVLIWVYRRKGDILKKVSRMEDD